MLNLYDERALNSLSCRANSIWDWVRTIFVIALEVPACLLEYQSRPTSLVHRTLAGVDRVIRVNTTAQL